MATQTYVWQQTQEQRDASLQRKLKNIFRHSDSGTVADEVLKIANFLLWVSLIITFATTLFSYEGFLTRFMPAEYATGGSFVFAAVIEVAKRYLVFYAIVWPILSPDLFKDRFETALWITLAVAGIGIFGVSMYNSTVKASQMASSAAFAKTNTRFEPNTLAIDQQIDAVQNQINAANNTKWKGTVTYQAQKASARLSSSLEKLQDQRTTLINQQREDFQRAQNQTDTENAAAASTTFSMGGYVECFQILLFFMIGISMRILVNRNPAAVYSPTTSTSKNAGIGFNKSPAMAENQPDKANERTIIKGFQRPQVENIAPEPVTQMPQAVTQIETHKGMLTGKEADAALKHWFTALQREPSNFGAKYANPQTVGKRVYLALMGMEHTLYGIESCSATLAEDIIRYYEDNLSKPMAENNIIVQELPEIWALLRSRATGREAAVA